jgi:hypothetical protein
MADTPRNPITIVINRPHGDPIRLRVKGAPTMMEDGSVNVTCKDERNRKYWVGINPDMLRMMMDVALKS